MSKYQEYQRRLSDVAQLNESSLIEAARGILNNYQEYDYNGDDYGFLAFCEDVVERQELLSKVGSH